jgi:hypothetical protein
MTSQQNHQTPPRLSPSTGKSGGAVTAVLIIVGLFMVLGGLLVGVLSILIGNSDPDKAVALGALIGLPLGLVVGLVVVLARHWRSDQRQDDSRSNPAPPKA